MKIAFWHYYTFRLRRGIETLIVSLANALARAGEEVSIITAKPTLEPLIAPDERIKIHAYPASRYFEHWSIVPFYVNHFLRHRYDHVVLFFADFGEGMTWRLLHSIKDLPLTLYLCYPYSRVPHRYRSFLKLGWDQVARHILSDAAWTAKEAEAVLKRKVPVVPVGTDPTRFCPDAEKRSRVRRQWGFLEDDVVLLNVSSLERCKGTWRALQAMGRLKDRFRKLKYFILGKGEDEANIKKAVEDFKLRGRVLFGGETQELESYYNMADIFVMLADAETNSLACHEAMSSGLPVVVSKTEGFMENVPPEAGFLVSLEMPEAIDEALIHLITDPALRHSMGSSGRTHILAHRTWDHIAKRYLEVLRNNTEASYLQNSSKNL